jgi:hypothetical protein
MLRTLPLFLYVSCSLITQAARAASPFSDGLLTPGLQSLLSPSEITATAENVNVQLTPSNSVDLLNVPHGVPGYVRPIHISCTPGQPNCGDGVITIFVDGEKSPSVTTDLNNLCLLGYIAKNIRLATPHISVEYNVNGGSTCEMEYPIPFRSSIHIVFTTSSDGGPTYLYSDMHYVKGHYIPYRLRSSNVTRLNSATYTPPEQDNGSVVFLQLINGHGWVVAHNITYSSAAAGNDSFLENSPVAFLDGASLSGEPQFRKNGGEDYFLSGWYFTQVPAATSFSMVTAKNTQPSTANISAGLDLLSYIGGLKFNHGIVMRLQGVPGKPTPASSTNVTISYLVLYYMTAER